MAKPPTEAPLPAEAGPAQLCGSAWQLQKGIPEKGLCALGLRDRQKEQGQTYLEA